MTKLWKKLQTEVDQMDMGYVVVFMLAFLAMWPFFRHFSLPAGTDAELHIYRLAELSRLVRDGEFYPRWSPNFYFGYGYPIFNYYAPLAYYVGLLFDFLPVVGPVGATKTVFVLGLYLGALGMYGFGRDNWGRSAGLVCAALYTYAPYVQYVDPHARGVLAESFSLGLFPLTLWAFDRLIHHANPGRWLAAALLMAGVVLAHNLLAMVWAGLLLGWLVWQLFNPQLNKKGVARGFVAYGLGIGLSAFFWLPVLLERHEIVLTVVGELGSHFDFRQHFLSPAELLSFSSWLDWGASEPAYKLNLGVAQWVWGSLGFFLAVQTAVRQKNWQPLFLALSALLLVGLMLPISQKVWELIPVLPFIQFPWRLLGPAAAVLALLGGYGTARLEKHYPASWLCLFTTLILAVPLVQVAPWPADFGETTVARVTYLETRGNWLGTTSTADYVPKTVDIVPERQGQLIGPLLENKTPDRLNYWSVESAGATARWEEISPLHTRYFVNTPQFFWLRLYQFAFPGWEVRIDGQVVETDIARPEGYLIIPVEAGEHVVDVQFVDTPPRRWGWQMAGISCFLLLLCAGWVKSAGVAPKLPFDGYLGELEILSLAVFALVVISLESTGWLQYESVTAAEPAQTALQVNFGNQIYLIGADLPEVTARPGETLDLTVYWRASQSLDINYQSFVHLLAADGFLVAQSDKLNPGQFPTHRWTPEKYVRDRYEITLPTGLAPGRYTLLIGLWVAAEGWRLPVLNETQSQIGDNYPLLEINVVP